MLQASLCHIVERWRGVETTSTLVLVGHWWTSISPRCSISASGGIGSFCWHRFPFRRDACAMCCEGHRNAKEASHSALVLFHSSFFMLSSQWQQAAQAIFLQITGRAWGFPRPVTLWSDLVSRCWKRLSVRLQVRDGRWANGLALVHYSSSEARVCCHTYS